MDLNLSPQFVMNVITATVAIAGAWGAARMGARYEGKLLRETIGRVDGHDDDLESVRMAQAEVRGTLQGTQGLLERVNRLSQQQAELRDNVAAIRTDVAVILTLLKQERH